jgi:hypothetical protein
MEDRKIRSTYCLRIYVLFCYLRSYHHRFALSHLRLWASYVRKLLWLWNITWSFRDCAKLIERVSKTVAALGVRPSSVLLVESLSHYRSCWYT